jgi:hypothetical protein
VDKERGLRERAGMSLASDGDSGLVCDEAGVCDVAEELTGI